MHTSILAIGLFADTLEVGLCRAGRITASRRFPIALSREGGAAQWIDTVRGLAPTLRSAVEEMQLATGGTRRRTCAAYVIYESPVAVADCFSGSPGVRNREHARLSAMLTATDALSATTDDVVTSSLYIGRDAAPASSARRVDQDAPDTGSHTAATGEGNGQPGGRTHVIAVAEAESIITAIRQMIEKAELKFAGAIPVHALIASTALQQDSPPSAAADGQQPTDDSPITCLLHLGEQGSFLVIRDRRGRGKIGKALGSLRFTRSISIGSDSLARALMVQSSNREQGTGAINNEPSAIENNTDAKPSAECRMSAGDGSACGGPNADCLDAARSALFELGLPDPRIPENLSAAHASTGLTGRDVLPLLQPLVQRLIVELRQSLRFSLEPAERSRASVIVSGMGANIPGLAAALQRELSVPTSPMPSAEHAAEGDAENSALLSQPVAALVELTRWQFTPSPMAEAIHELKLLPNEMALHNTVGRVRQALWAGAAAALLLIGLDAGRLQTRLSETRDAVIEAEAVASGKLIAERAGLIPPRTPQEMAFVIEQGQSFKKSVEHEIAHSVNFRAAMQELSMLAPESIRFNTLAFQTGRVDADMQAVTAILGGVARNSEGPGASPRAELEQFMQHLRSSPLFDDVSLANVQQATDAEGPSRRFEVRLALVPTLLAQTVSTGGSEPESGESDDPPSISHQPAAMSDHPSSLMAQGSSEDQP